MAISSCKEDEIRHEVAGIIRRVEPNSWYVINDTSHSSLGISNIAEDNEKIVIYYDFNATKIHTFSVTPDETFSAMGYICGASVGLDRAYIYISKMDSGQIVPVDPTTINDNRGNFWIYGLFTE
jgi:hypothetical protein